MRNILSLNISENDIIEWYKSIYAKAIEEGWEIFKVYNEYFYSVKVRKPYDAGETQFNEDGYKYNMYHININNTKEYLFLKSKGYDVDGFFE